MPDLSLSSLVAPIPKQVFLDEYWRKKPLLVPGDPARLHLVEALLGSTDLRTLMGKSKVKVWQDDGSDIDDPPVDAAMGYYSQGYTIYLNLSRKEPIYAQVQAVARELGEVPTSSLFSMFAVKGAHGSTPHFDRYDVLTVQLRGTKRWRIAPSDFFVKNPDRNWAMGHPAPPFADATKLPTEMPADAAEFELGPGAVLYTPAGHLHYATAGAEDSLSCNLTVPTVLWSEALTKIVGYKLTQDERMRETITGMFGDGWNRPQLAADLPRILGKLQRIVAEMSVEELLKIASDEALLRILK